MSDEYSFVARGKLKLKSDISIKKKKKKSKDKEKKVAEKTCSEEQQSGTSNVNFAYNVNTVQERKLTDAEKKFKKQQEKMRQKRILEMASTTHKQRVEKFNEHLDSLTEHFDIPKVSWTK